MTTRVVSNPEEIDAQVAQIRKLAVSIRWVALHFSWGAATRILREVERVVGSGHLSRTERLLLLETWHAQIWLLDGSYDSLRAKELASKAAEKGVLGPP